MKRMMYIVFALFNFGHLLVAQTTIQNRLDSLFLRTYQNNQFCGQVLIGNLDSVIYHRAFGWANKEQNDTIDLTTPMRLASVSKTITAIAIMQLQESGLINVDDPVQKYLPQIPYKDITIKQLLSHTSGITYLNGKIHFFRMNRISNKYYGDLTNNGMLKYFEEKKTWRSNKAGKKFKYSNGGYSILASLIEKVSGMSYSKYLTEQVFNPLGMDSSFVFSKTTLKEHDIAWSYTYRKNKIRKYEKGYYRNKEGQLIPRLILYGDKHIFSNVLDMYTLDTALFNNYLFSKETTKQMITPVNLIDGSVNQGKYAFGWYQHPFVEGVMHTGNIEYYTTLNFVDTEGNIIILLSNKSLSSLYWPVIYSLKILEGNNLKYPRLDKLDKKSKNVFDRDFKVEYEHLK